MKGDTKTVFSSEADLCSTFLSLIGPDWLAYQETGGFDILLCRRSDGVQIGIEAKLTLNAKVVSQILPKYRHETESPDYRAVLVPAGTGTDLVSICAHLGITVLQTRTEKRWQRMEEIEVKTFRPELPKVDTNEWDLERWHEWMPISRISLPDYVPDVTAGKSAPVALTTWKIKAIKLAILLESRPVTRTDFKALKLSPSRWTDPWTGWLVRNHALGGYTAGQHMPDFKSQHPLNYEQIKADSAKWMVAAGLRIEVAV